MERNRISPMPIIIDTRAQSPFKPDPKSPVTQLPIPLPHAIMYSKTIVYQQKCLNRLCNVVAGTTSG